MLNFRYTEEGSKNFKRVLYQLKTLKHRLASCPFFVNWMQITVSNNKSVIPWLTNALFIVEIAIAKNFVIKFISFTPTQLTYMWNI
ncbi:hypothetical protein T4B_5177 [Trichinella pseudospiralis]|uniref:Uncharacterized protein n=1 Tax=Trichinella pseudospiralis TaxID=6337 RepID=A0A0V1J8I7_TRIPS|nr:hypothetical protein T4B_5177 [Trichinella pseudospiralis]